MSIFHDHEDLEILLELRGLSLEERMFRLQMYQASLQRHSLEELHALYKLTQVNARTLKEILLAVSPSTKSIANIFLGESTMANNALVFNVGQTSIDTITPLLADGVTPSGGTLSNVIVNFSDPSATFVLNPDNTVTFTAVAASTGGTPVNGTTQATVTDTDGAVATFSQGFTVLVNAVVPPSQLTQSIANVFSNPTP